MPDKILARAWKDWSGRGWLIRTICMGAFAVFIGYKLGPHLKMAHYEPWVGNWLAGFLAAVAWGLATLLISALKAPGNIIKEKNQEINRAGDRIKELEATRPRLSACLADHSDALFLVISNDGAGAAEVSAKITISGDAMSPQTDAYAIWNNEPDGRERVRIDAGDQKMILVCEAGTEGQDFFHWYWFIPFISNGKKDRTRPFTGLFPSSRAWLGDDKAVPEEAQEIRQRVSLRVTSEPASLSPLIQCSITLVGYNHWEGLSGVALCAQPPTDLAYENWTRFYSRARGMLGHYYIVKRLYDAEALDQDDWSGFKFLADEALALSNQLQESHQEQARRLLQPIVDVVRSSLDSCPVEDLEGWLKSTNHSFLIQRWR